MIFLAFIAYLLTAAIAFGKLLFTFFQQDEWAIFGNYIYWQKEHLNWWTRLFIYEQDTHIVPVSNFLSYAQYALFKLSFAPYALVSISIHIINALLVYYLATLFIKNKYVAFIAGLLFLTNPITHQSIIWIATTAGTAGSTFFVLLSIIFFVRFLRSGEKIYHLILSMVFLVLSLLSKETSLFIFIFYPFLWLLYGNKKSIFKGIKLFFPFVILGILYILFRLFFLLFGYHPTSTTEELSQPSLIVYFFRVITLPLKFIAQSFLPVPFIIAIGGIIVELGYPHFMLGATPDPYVVQTVASDIVSYLMAFAIIALSLFLFTFKQVKQLGIHKLVIISGIFIALSSLPFIFIPGAAGYVSLLDGRHLYLTSIFSSILLAGLLFSLYRTLHYKKLILVLIILIVVGFSGFNMLRIRGDLNTQMGLAFTRKSILQKIYSSYPKLPKKVIFYFESNTAFYGLPNEEKILPFQSGFGQTLLVWYHNHDENIPACFFQGKYLYSLLSQEYKECSERGFGYFRNITLLRESLLKNNLSSDDVIAFRYNSFTNSLLDITKEVQNELQ